MNTLAFDAETDGLWGPVFAIGAVVFDPSGKEVDRFVGRARRAVTNPWVVANVLPQLTRVPVTAESLEQLSGHFANFYLRHKDTSEVVSHWGYICEARVLRDMRANGFIGEWDGPAPLFDVSGNLQAAGYDPGSVDKYAALHGLTPSQEEFGGGVHNPLYDAAVIARVYQHLRRREERRLAEAVDGID